MFANYVLNTTARVQEIGVVNPASLAAVYSLCQIFSKVTGIIGFNRAYLVVYFIIVTGIIAISWPFFTFIKKLKLKDEKIWIIFLMTFVYALVCPRFKNYSYIILIPATYFIIKRAAYIKPYVLLFILICISPNITLPGFPRYINNFLWDYRCLIIAYFMWVLYLYEILFLRKQKLNQQIIT
jgi:hypothetical protein